MDFRIDMNAGTPVMTFEKATDIRNNILLSLTVRRGSWFQNPDFGSRLHLLERSKNTPRTSQLAIDYAKEALRWLIDTGKAKSIDVSAERNALQDNGCLKLLVEAVQANEARVAFTAFVEVV